MTFPLKSHTPPYLLLATAILAIAVSEASALIIGGAGNLPISDPGWPAGAAAIFNVNSRIAWWEGPPFGGGQWHAECRGDAKALSAVLADFEKLDVKSKRIVLHDGVGHSFWLNPNNEADKRQAARMDWRFMVWQPDNWKRLSQLPAQLNPTEPEDAETGPPSQIDIYVGGNVKWAEVVVPKGIKVIDQRLEAHGFTLADGVVLEGKIIDLATNKPLSAKMRLELVEPLKEGGYRYSTVLSVDADAQGHWVLKKAPAGWHRLVIDAEGYVPRVIGYSRHDDQPDWQFFDSGLGPPTVVAGRVTDDEGKPLADVIVRVRDITVAKGVQYESPLDREIKTGADGRFSISQIPFGQAAVWVHKPGFTQVGQSQIFTMPKVDLELAMTRAGQIVVTVDFIGKQRPQAYNVQLEPEGGNAVGKFGGSGHIDDQNQITFSNVPPGRYVLRGRPNPGSTRQETDPVTIDVQASQTAQVKLMAK
jgi:hypothetical protein